MDPLLVRIFDVDFYMSSPIQHLDITFSQFRGSATHQVPVLRVFGSTDVGKKICVHIHGVFPYFYIPYDGSEAANGLMYKIASNLDKAINISLGQASSNNHHIYKIVLVSGIPFYGYHSKKHQFFKVYLYNPMLLKRVNNLLFNESILGKIYQPHETHLNFTLQFMIDYNLHGMSNVVLSQVKYRKEVGQNEYIDQNPSKVSSCELECDVLGEYILNRKEVESGNLAANPGIAALWEDERQRRRNKNEDSQLPHYLSLSKTNVPPTESHELFRRALHERFAMLSQDTDKNDFNLSVYPAECRQHENLLNCSNIDFHSPLNTQEEVSFDSELDQTITNETLNITLDQDIQDLVDVLRDLEKDVAEEEDSILSQVPKNEEVEEDHDMKISTESCEDMLNETIKLSQIFGDYGTEKEAGNIEVDVGEENKGASIPQLDGNCSDFEAEVKKKSDELVKFKQKHLSSINVSRNSVSNGGNKIVLHSIHILQTANKRSEIDNNEHCEINGSVTIELNVSDNKDQSHEDCVLKHSFPHVENTFKEQLRNPRVLAARSENKEIIQSIINKTYPYFRAPSIGERVALKNNVKRNKQMLKNILECPCELVAVSKKLDSPIVVKKLRNMPSLNSVSSSDSSYEPPTVWKPLRKSKPKRRAKKKKQKTKEVVEKKKFAKNPYKKKLLVNELKKEFEKCYESLEKGAKPIFKIVPGYRPYTFYGIKIHNKGIEITWSKKTISSDNHIGENNNGGAIDRNNVINSKEKHLSWKQSLQNDDEVGKPLFGQSMMNKRLLVDLSKEKQKCSSYLVTENACCENFMTWCVKTTPLDETKPEDAVKVPNKMSPSFSPIEEARTSPLRAVETTNKQNLDKEDNNNNSEYPCFQQKTISEIIRAQKQNEALFFSSVNSLMENFSISESKLLKPSETEEYKTRRKLQFLDGAFDDSDEDDKEKRRSRSSRKRTKSVYASLPVYATSSAGKSAPISTKTDPEKKKEDEITRKEHYENLNHIKRKINFDCSSHQEKHKTENHNDRHSVESSSSQSNKKDVIKNIDIIKTSNRHLDHGTEQIKGKTKSSFDRKEIQNTETNVAPTSSDTHRKEAVEQNIESINTKTYHHANQKKKYVENNETAGVATSCFTNQKENTEKFSSYASHRTEETGENTSSNEDPPSQHGVDLVNELTERTRAFFSMFQQSAQGQLNHGDGQTIPDLSKVFLVPPETGMQQTDQEPVDPHGYVTPVLDKDGNDISKSFLDETQHSLMIQRAYRRMSASELYDIANNFFPQPSTSKIVDPIPENNNDDEELDDAWLSSPEGANCVETPPLLPEGVVDAVMPSSGSEISTSKVRRTVYDYSGSIKPIYKPPTRKDVIQSMPEYGLPMLRTQEPFYSNVEDASGAMEVGYNTLKVRTKTSMDVPEFQSSFQGLEYVRKKYYPLDLSGGQSNAKYFYCRQGTCLLKPAINPPTYKDVEKWIQKNSEPAKKVEKVMTRKSKVYFASSQDPCSDNDVSMDLTLTLSPTTPKAVSDSQGSNATSQWSSLKEETYILSPISSRGESPVLSETREGRVSDSEGNSTPRSSKSRESRGSSPVLVPSRGRKRLDRSMALRKSALLSQNSDHSGIISGASLNNTYGFQCSVQNYMKARASVKYEYLTILSMELHVNTRGDFKPNPQYDQVQAIFYSISNDVEEDAAKPRRSEGLFAISSKERKFLDGTGVSSDIKYVKDELELLKEFSKFVIDWDPDILLGYEIQMLSWGYLIERCHHLGVNIIPEISRVKDKHLKFNEKETGDLRVTGRVVLDLWRLLRHEVALQSYTIQSTVYEILQKRIPMYSFKDLTAWWSHRSSLFRHRTVNYYMTCVNCQLKILEQLDFVGRTSELARLFGIQFYEVLSRGSQFRVESMMLRLAKPMNYVAVSPSVQQRAKMRAPEYIALVLEPESKLYTDPVIVLDFQSLYPSIIIAYNYCFSTCAGRVELLGKNSPFEFGATNLKVSKERIKHLHRRNLLNFSPCGVAFVKKSVRDGIMPRMLREILDTRLMVKKSMKENKEDAVLQKVLHSRQLGLKLIANVTYGYTAANFSGRMPSVELGDSIVSKARETLQRTISLVDGNKKWGARVVYGDTDSLFVLCPGKTRAEAFAIGEQIVEAVGRENPDPVKLKLEKVYQPCVLQTKKRYVGYMYESPDQEEPTYDAKGIETVRRDGCPAVSKMLEKTLRILFETKDVSKVKEYCVKQFNKIVMGRISIKDLTFAKEFRGLTGYRPGACVPSLELAKKWVAVDKRAEPRRGERVPYVIINGPPGLPLIRLVRSPHDLLKDPALRPNALYYITRVIIPPLNRCFNLIGVDLHHWFAHMPRKHLQYLPTNTSPTKKTTISQYFVSTLCAVCGVQAQNGLCENCVQKQQQTVTILSERVRKWETAFNNCKLICSTCTQIPEEPKCISLDCPVLYRLNQTSRDVQQADHIRHLLCQYFDIF